MVEWIDFLGEAMRHPVRVRDGHYALPSVPGWGLELQDDFVTQYLYPDGPFWKERPDAMKGARFEA